MLVSPPPCRARRPDLLFVPRPPNRTNALGSTRLWGLGLWVMALALLVCGNANAAAGRTNAASAQAAVRASQATPASNATAVAELGRTVIETGDAEAVFSSADPDEEPDQAAHRAPA